jgi:hypothetical protein
MVYFRLEGEDWRFEGVVAWERQEEFEVAALRDWSVS